MTNRRNIRILSVALLAGLLSLLPRYCFAVEKTFDFLTALGYADVHKMKIESLTARNLTEGITYSQHTEEKNAVGDYKDSEKKLRRLYNCMSAISAIMQGGATIFNTIGTLNQVTNKLITFYKLYNDYYKNYLSKGNILQSDLTIWNASKNTYEGLKFEVRQLSKSYIDLETFLVTSKVLTMEMKAKEFSRITWDINNAYERILGILDASIFTISTYLAMRSGFMSYALTRCTKVNSIELQKEALRRWRTSIAIAHPDRRELADFTVYNTNLMNTMHAESAAMKGKIDKGLAKVRLSSSLGNFGNLKPWSPNFRNINF